MKHINAYSLSFLFANFSEVQKIVTEILKYDAEERLVVRQAISKLSMMSITLIKSAEVYNRADTSEEDKETIRDGVKELLVSTVKLVCDVLEDEAITSLDIVENSAMLHRDVFRYVYTMLRNDRSIDELLTEGWEIFYA